MGETVRPALPGLSVGVLRKAHFSRTLHGWVEYLQPLKELLELRVELV
jgi:hypothetical protein